MTQKQLVETIQENIEWLSTTEGNEVECIGIENLESILSKYLGKKVRISLDAETIVEKESRFKQLELF
jgi:hypothetical protein